MGKSRKYAFNSENEYAESNNINVRLLKFMKLTTNEVTDKNIQNETNKNTNISLCTEEQVSQDEINENHEYFNNITAENAVGICSSRSNESKVCHRKLIRLRTYEIIDRKIEVKPEQGQCGKAENKNTSVNDKNDVKLPSTEENGLNMHNCVHDSVQLRPKNNSFMEMRKYDNDDSRIVHELVLNKFEKKIKEHRRRSYKRQSFKEQILEWQL